MKETKITRGNRTRTITIIPLALFGVLSIIASGGGGGGGGGSAGFNATSEGVASKGIIRNGVVTAEELNSSGVAVRTVGSAETNTQGKYSLSVGSAYTGGPIKLTISGKSDGSTKMVCDVAAGCTDGGNTAAYGGTLTLGTDFAMTAIVPPVSDGESIGAQITPFTQMAAARVLAGGTVDADSVNNAISEVNQIVGVNILDVEPVDITDATAKAGASSEAVTYAAFLAGAGKVILTGGDLMDGLDQLAQSFEDGMLTEADPIKPDALVDAVDSEAVANGVDTNPVLTQVLAVFHAGISGDCNTSCSYNPEPSDTATQTAVAQARALMKETRSWLTSLEDLQTPLDNFGAALEAGGDVLDANSEVLGNTLGYVLAAVLEALPSLDPGTHMLTVVDDMANTLGTVSVTLSDNGGAGITINGSNLGGVSVSLTATSNLPGDNLLDGTPFDLSSADLHISGTVSNAQASMSLDQMAFSATFESPVTVDPTTNSSDVDPVFTDMSLAGGLTLQAGGASFSGDATMTFVTLNSPPSAIGIDVPTLAMISLSQMELSGDFVAGGNSFNASLTLDVNNAGDFDTLGLLIHDSYEWANLWNPTDELNATSYANTNFGIVTLQYANYYFYTDQTCFGGLDGSAGPVYQCAAGDVLQAGNYLAGMYPDAEMVSNVTYYYSNYGAPSTQVTADIDYPDFESVSNFADATLSLTLDLTLQGYPDTTATVSGNRMAFEGGDVTVTFTHGGHNVTFMASKADGGTPGDGTLTVTNPDGVKLELAATEGAVTGTLKVGTTQVGTVEQTSNDLIIARYSDGTFETLQ